MDTAMDKRAELASQHEAFVKALLMGADFEGLDEQQVRAARLGLFTKRLRRIGHHYPGLVLGIERGTDAWERALEWHFQEPFRGDVIQEARGLVQAVGVKNLPSAAGYDVARLAMVGKRGPYVKRIPEFGLVVWGWGKHGRILQRRVG